MKVFGQNPYINLEAYAKNVKGRGRAVTESDRDTTIADKQAGGRVEENVVLSPEALEIHSARKKLEEMPEVRQEMVNRIKKELMNGTYEVDSEKVASKMLEESLLNEIL